MSRIKELAEALFKNEPSNIRIIQLTRFVISGGFTASIDFLLFWLLTNVFGWHYIIAVTISFVFASTLNYYLSVKWVFFSGKFSSQFLEYIVFILFTFLGLLLNYLVLYLGIDILNINNLIVRLCSIFIVTVFNFLTKKLFVFKC